MIHTTFLTLSVAIWAAAVLAAVFCRLPGRRRAAVRPMTFMLIGTFLAVASLLAPIYRAAFGAGFAGGFKTVLISIHSALRMFGLRGEFTIIEAYAKGLPLPYDSWYSVWAAFLYILAPILTLGFVLSFFKYLSAYHRYLFQYRREAHIFSALNERSLALAASIRAKYPQAAIVFTGARGHESENLAVLVEKARSIRAILFKDDITGQILRRHGKKAAMSFYVIGGGGERDTEYALSLIREFRMREKTRLYVFSSRPETEPLIHSAMSGAARIKVFQVNEAQSLIYRFLHEHSIFANALPTADGKLISALLLGLGQYGSEMLRALCWCGQMNGYRLEIHAFDQDPGAVARLAAACPELMARNNDLAPDEARYSIRFHGGIDYRTPDFAHALENTAITFAFVSLGDDVRNLDAALSLRTFFERQNQHPELFTVIDSPTQASLIREHKLVNFKSQDYRIQVIGDLAERCSYDTVVHSELEREALRLHRRWGSEAEFYRFAYHYRSSMASAIHAKWRALCGIQQGDLPELEHKRWNAYMRAEGYVYSGSTCASSRNDLAKRHNDLVGFHSLPVAEVKKDVDITRE